jgi:hypothetical protein
VPRGVMPLDGIESQPCWAKAGEENAMVGPAQRRGEGQQETNGDGWGSVHLERDVAMEEFNTRPSAQREGQELVDHPIGMRKETPTLNDESHDRGLETTTGVLIGALRQAQDCAGDSGAAKRQKPSINRPMRVREPLR